MRSNKIELSALILARGGSKRVKGKNLREISPGVSLLKVQISLARALNLRVTVSSDCDIILKEGRENGAKVLKRPRYLSGDTVTSADSAIHAISHLSGNTILLLQATCPLTEKEDIERGIKAYNLYRKPVFSAIEMREARYLRNFEGPLFPDFQEARTQNLPPLFLPTGNFYLISYKKLLETKSFMADSVPSLIHRDNYIDIDTEEDLRRAKWLYQQRLEAHRTYAPGLAAI